MPHTISGLPRLNPAIANGIANGQLSTLLAQAAAKDGPILRWDINWDGLRTLVFMVGPDANRFVLHTHRDHFSHDLGWTPLIGPDFGKGLLNMDDPQHAVHRKMWNPAFTQGYMATYLPAMMQIVRQRTATWLARREVDVLNEAREITFDVAAATLAGIGTGTDVDHLRNLFYTIMHGFDQAQEQFSQYMMRAGRAREELTNILLGLIAERRQRPPTGQPRDVLEMIVHTPDDRGQTLSDQQVLAHVNILLLAGHETTTTLGAWALYLLATQPSYRHAIQAEVDALPFDADGVPSIERLRSAKQLDAFIKETGRLYSPVMIVPRGIAKDVEFNGYTLPQGTQIRLAYGAGHRLPTVWQEPERFDPERFAPPREEDKQHPYALATFGGGSRICIGINFAQLEVKALVAYVLRNFDLEAARETVPVHGGFINAEIPGGIPMRVRRRVEI